jgi:hypothetical protein
VGYLKGLKGGIILSKDARINIEKNLLVTINEFFKNILKKGSADIMLIPQELPSKVSTVQTLVKDPEGGIRSTL